MALQPQKVSFPFVASMDTKTDSFQRAIGSLDLVVNGVYDSPNSIKKRTGYTKLNTTSVTASRLFEYNKELLLCDSRKFYSYNPTQNDAFYKTYDYNALNATPTTNQLLASGVPYDCLYINGLTYYIIDSSILVEDYNTKGLLNRAGTPIGVGIGTSVRAKLAYIGSIVYVIAITGTSLFYQKVILTGNTVSLDTPVTIASDVHATDKYMDTCSDSVLNRAYVVYKNSSSNPSVKFIRDGGTFAGSSLSPETTTTSVSIDTDSTGKVIVGWNPSGSAKAAIFNTDLASYYLSPTTVATVTGLTNVTVSKETASTFRVIYEYPGAGGFSYLGGIGNYICTYSGTPTAQSGAGFLALASKAFTVGDYKYIIAVLNSTIQPTYVVLLMNIAGVSGVVAARMFPGLAGDTYATGSLPSVSSVTSSEVQSIIKVRGRLQSSGNNVYTSNQIKALNLNFSTKMKLKKLNTDAIISGGYLKTYAGGSVSEHGFHWFPEQLKAGSNAASGGFMSNGTYQYCAVFSYTEDNGSIYRSAPSIPLSITTSAGGTAQTQAVTVPGLQLTTRSGYNIDLYRTEASGTVFYKCYTQAMIRSDQQVSIVDTIADSTLISNEILYTTGGELDNITPGSASIIEEYYSGDRVFLAGLEDPYVIQYSKLKVSGSPIEFNDSLTIQTPSIGGPITALASYDDKLLVFKKYAIYWMSGDGPTNTGDQNNFTQLELLSSEIGCIDRDSVVKTPSGVMFKSAKGIYIISKDKGFAVEYIGAGVEQYNNLTINSASMYADKNRAIFLTDEVALVYDTLFSKWSIFTNHMGTDSIVVDGVYYYIRNGEIYKQSSLFSDNGSHIPLKIETSWISFAGVQGYQRVYRSDILAHFKSPHKLLINVAYDFKDGWYQTKLIDTDDFIDYTTYGDVSPYGSESVYGGSSNKYKVRLNFKKQKCESIKISIEDVLSVFSGESLELSNLLFYVGAAAPDFKTSVQYSTQD